MYINDIIGKRSVMVPFQIGFFRQYITFLNCIDLKSTAIYFKNGYRIPARSFTYHKPQNIFKIGI